MHGDFGSNNVLVDPDSASVTGVLDWDEALYGDPLFDVAGTHFWRTWLVCMDKSADYWDRRLGDLPHYRERIRCYELRGGLREIHDSARDGDTKTLAWIHNRCIEVLEARL